MSVDVYPKEPLKARISDTESVYIRADASTHSIQTVDYAHHEIHSGSHYFYASHHDVAKAGSIDHLIITPDTTKWAHMIIAVSSTAGQVHVELFEDATVSANGTLEPTMNRNRNVADNNTTEIYETPTVTTTGTVIDSSSFGTNNKNTSVGGGERGNNEIVLKQNSIYLFRVTETNVAATTVNILFDWYEHTDKD